jgi:hypothetical protein
MERRMQRNEVGVTVNVTAKGVEVLEQAAEGIVFSGPLFFFC